jgi:hypothetical protein
MKGDKNISMYSGTADSSLDAINWRNTENRKNQLELIEGV